MQNKFKLTLLCSKPPLPTTYGQIMDAEGKRLVCTVGPIFRQRIEQAMPDGEYCLSLERHRILGDRVVVKDVPGIGDVRMARNNLLGNSPSALVLGTDPNLKDSRAAVALMCDMVEQAIARGETVTLCVVNQ